MSAHALSGTDMPEPPPAAAEPLRVVAPPVVLRAPEPATSLPVLAPVKNEPRSPRRTVPVSAGVASVASAAPAPRPAGLAASTGAAASTRPARLPMSDIDLGY